MKNPNSSPDSASMTRSEDMAMRHSKMTPGRKNRLKQALSAPIRRKSGVVLPAQGNSTPNGSGNS